ncbi:MAG: DUF4070 domain-containing protein [Proteobacteria bacterium]|uniref:DUF4070 domain-containing protein n=1 Tax=Acidiphilium sp. TaxID=527 RepID=UPI00258A4920|nr:DUF4070 domain-containing protein [Acidiphilium sp.]MBW4036828.1 DUF4070 domain-containing protein [Pseudomonadota bacterium]
MKVRLDVSDNPSYGTNVIPAALTRAALRDGYVATLTALHESDLYFDRLDCLYFDGPLARDYGRTAQPGRWSWRRRVEQGRLLARTLVLLGRSQVRVPGPGSRAIYRRRFRRVLVTRPIPAVLFVYALRTPMHYHAWALAKGMAKPDREIVNSY